MIKLHLGTSKQVVTLTSSHSTSWSEPQVSLLKFPIIFPSFKDCLLLLLDTLMRAACISAHIFQVLTSILLLTAH